MTTRAMTAGRTSGIALRPCALAAACALGFLIAMWAIAAALVSLGMAGDGARSAAFVVLAAPSAVLYVRLHPKDSADQAKKAGFADVAGLALVAVALSLATRLVAGDAAAAVDPTLLNVVGVGIAGPIVEETLYRGLVMENLEPVMGRWGALAVSTLLFAVAHVDVVRILLACVAGAVFGLVHLRYRDMRLTAFVHVVVNIIGFI